MIVLEHTDQLTDEAVQEFRRTQGIGASEAGAAAGLSKWQSPYALWAQKTGEVGRTPQTPAMAWGHRMEPVILEAASQELGLVITRPHHIVASDEHPFMFASPDGYAWDLAKDEIIGPVQAKYHAFSDDGYDDDAVPDECLLQVQQELYCTGHQSGWLAVLLPRGDFRVIPIERDEAMIEKLIELEARMWEMVQAGTAPAVDGHRATTDVIKRMFPKGVKETVELDPSIIDLLERRRLVKREEKTRKAYVDEVENQIKAALGDAEVGTIDGQVVVRWSTVEKDGYFVKPSTSRRLTVPKR